MVVKLALGDQGGCEATYVERDVQV